MGDEICERGIRDNALSHGTRMILGLFRQPRQTCARLRNRQQLQETALLHGNGVEQNVFETPRVVGMRGINLWPATKRRVTSFRPIFQGHRVCRARSSKVHRSLLAITTRIMARKLEEGERGKRKRGCGNCFVSGRRMPTL